MKNILLIGLGRFGRHCARKLNELGHQVMAVDVREDASPEIQCTRIDGIEEELQEQRHIDEAPEDLVSDDEVPAFLHVSSY